MKIIYYGFLLFLIFSGNAARAQRIVQLATGATAAEIERVLSEADGNVKVAIVSLLTGLDSASARSQLAGANDNVRLALRR